MGRTRIIACPHCTARVLLTADGLCPVCRKPVGLVLDGVRGAPGMVRAFYCRDCDAVFEAAPDGSGYEQTPCPRCGEMCMTVEFERQEKKRHRKERGIFSLLMDVFSPYPVELAGKGTDDNSTTSEQPVTIVTYDDRALAERDAELLDGEGILAALAIAEAGGAPWTGTGNRHWIELQVRSADAPRAMRILRDLDPPAARRSATQPPAGNVKFPCHSCGKALSFPSQRRGNVETCPYCAAYVDVPD